MERHTALLDLPDLLRAEGLNVVVHEGWDTAQGDYFWLNQNGERNLDPYTGHPQAILYHGTAGTHARPVVRDGHGVWSKANAWTGLDNGTGYLSTHRTSPDQVPAIHLTSAGPARYSAGYGYWPVLRDFVFNDLRPPLDAEGPDGTTAGNRFTFNVENVHPNDGSRIDPDVYDHLVGLGVVLHRMFDWRERALFHRSWTRRKPVDPYFQPGPVSVLQDDIQGELMTPPIHLIVDAVDPDMEPVSWRLFRLEGGVKRNDTDSSQILEKLPWKLPQTINGVFVPGVRIVYREDLELVGKHLGFTEEQTAALVRDGLYKKGWEIDKLADVLTQRYVTDAVT